ncbi:acyl-CoA dehydrogenase [Alicycliphilus denitrificans]|uniref:acyl-CoA dehydrogenase family protein n=1 Tax=Alicycliphilus denitrificans TaxID=179636 RepID=UPI000964ADCD|nr:acyl-CoA dehydrogenase family protein [Alicycliphilus denitrificans]MBN9576412.1 acyl-CoA dehydrogenase family protein [Alicycliphilus denitrificans]OJW83091.1 MAG: DNA alkylation response protein [Alicycliphilus sp. 69-12]BCN40152.1 acyl-CoA dehydrogenase [Alicycliphilus denitrificans]
MTFLPRYGAFARQRPAASRQSSDKLAPDCAGLDFFEIDQSLQQLLPLYVPQAELQYFLPHFKRLGQLAGGRLNELAIVADKHGPVLHARSRWGEDEDWVEYHPAYQEMEHIAFEQLQFHAMTHRPGAMGYPGTLSPVTKYVFQYLFVQSEFGQMCPISVTDTSIHLIRKFGSEELKARLLPRMLADKLEDLWKGTQFMTEKAGGSDVGQVETTARLIDGQWHLFGEKWFSSHVDADVALILARPENAPAGTRGLALFAMPRHREDGSRNSYRIVRLKDKLGTRSMASGELRIEGAFAYLVGDPARGLKQMMEQVNLSRLSHAVRAAAMMRRCLNESLQAARHRHAFGQRVMDYPLMQRQLLKIIVPTEAALSVTLATADMMAKGYAGDEQSQAALRLLTPLLKLRACRDNITVATGAMEARGGNGYIEDFVNARLVRDAHIGVLWEGTSNINALDAIGRAVRKDRAHVALQALLLQKLPPVQSAAPGIARQLAQALDEAVALAETVAAHPEFEPEVRRAASALYYAAAAILLAWESTQAGVDGRRLLLADAVLRAHLLPAHPLAAPSAATHGPDAAMLGSEKLSLRQAAMLLAPAQGQDPATAVSAARRPELVE